MSVSEVTVIVRVALVSLVVSLVCTAGSAVAAPSWQQVETLAPTQALANVSLAVDSKGDALALWDRAEPPDTSGAYQYVVLASYRPAGSDRWQEPVTLDTDSWYGRPAVAFDGLGNATVVWNHAPADYTQGPLPLSSVRDAATGKWTSPLQVAPGPFYAASQLGVDVAGDAVLGWYDGETSYRPAGGAWQPPTRPLDVSDPNLAVAPDGSMLLAGRRYDGTVYAATGDHGNWSGSVRLGTSTAYVAPAAAVAPGGNAVVAWSTAEHGNNIVYTAVRRSGAWEPAKAVSFVDGNAYGPAVGIDDANNALAIWDATVDPESSFRPAASSTWERPVVAGPPIGYPSPTLAMNAAGDAVAVWVGFTTSPTGGASDFPVGGAYFTAAGGWQAAHTLGSEGSNSDQNAAVAIDGRGDAIAVWPHFNGFDVNRRTVATLQSAILDNGGPLLHAVYDHVPPHVAGSARAGSQVRCARGVWTGAAPIQFAFRWLRAVRVVGHTQTYRIKQPDSAHSLSCRVTATNPFGSVAATSRPVRVRG